MKEIIYLLFYIILLHLNLSNANENLAESIELKNSHSNWGYDYDPINLGKNLTNKDLIEMSENLTKYFDLSVKPCDNFYQYVCGNWHKYHKLPKKSNNKHNEILTPMNIFNNEIMNTFLKILKENRASGMGLSNNNDKIKTYYQSCSNRNLYSHNSVSQIMDYLKRNDYVMPELSYRDWNDSKFQWLKAIIFAKNHFGFDILVGTDIAEEKYDTMKLVIDDPKLSVVPREYYLNKTFEYELNNYRNQIQRNLKKMGVSEEHAENLSNEFIYLEKSIYNKTILNPQLTHISVYDLEQRYPIFQWGDYVTKVGLNFFRNNGRDEQIRANENYLKSISVVIGQTSQTLLANYIYYKTVENFLDYFDVPDHPDREPYCLELVKKFFPKQIQQMYYARFKNDIKRGKLDVILHYLKAAFNTTINHHVNINTEIKRKILDKINKLKISYDEFNKNDDSSKILDDIKIDLNFFENTLKLLRYKQRKWQNKQSYNNINNNDFDVTYDVIYDASTNSLNIPIFMLQHPFYNLNYPPAINYGRLVVYMAKTLSLIMVPKPDRRQRFDYPIYTELTQIPWDYHSINTLNEKRTCFTESNLQTGKLYINANRTKRLLTEDEIFAETGAVELAFQAYLLYLAGQYDTEFLRQTETLPEFDFTNTQLFFISYAQNWCKNIKYKSEYYKFDLFTSLVNFKEFATEFRCTDGSWMKQMENCSLWGV